MTLSILIWSKALGAVLVIAGFSLFGIRLDQRKKTQIAVLIELLRSLEALRAEIGLSLMPIPDVLESAGRSSRGEVRLFYEQCTRLISLRGAQFFSEIWTESVESCLPGLSPAQRDTIRALSNTLGRYGVEDQVLALQHVEIRLRASLEEAERENTRTGRLHITVSCALGIAVVLLFL